MWHGIVDLSGQSTVLRPYFWSLEHVWRPVCERRRHIRKLPEMNVPRQGNMESAPGNVALCDHGERRAVRPGS